VPIYDVWQNFRASGFDGGGPRRAHHGECRARADLDDDRLFADDDLVDQVPKVDAPDRVVLRGERRAHPALESLDCLRQASYPSFGLRFDVTKAGEKPETLVRRVNAADREGKVSEANDFSEWDLGRLRAARYSLVVSIETDKAEVDVYTPVVAMIGLER
jgi:hypothetical protein